jgi:hypothetical protein
MHRGDICIHAAKFQPVLSPQLRQAMRNAGIDPDMKYPKGVILCVVDLHQCEFTEILKENLGTSSLELDFGNFDDGRYGYETCDLRVLPEPVPCRGCQALHWEVPADVAAEVERQLRILETSKHAAAFGSG